MSGIDEEVQLFEKQTRQWGVRVVSATKIPSSINLAMEVAVSGFSGKRGFTAQLKDPTKKRFPHLDHALRIPPPTSNIDHGEEATGQGSPGGPTGAMNPPPL